MPYFTIRLTRAATEVATIEVSAAKEIDAINLAFKEIDRLKDKPQDKRIISVQLELHPEPGSPWEEIV